MFNALLQISSRVLSVVGVLWCIAVLFTGCGGKSGGAAGPTTGQGTGAGSGSGFSISGDGGTAGTSGGGFNLPGLGDAGVSSSADGGSGGLNVAAVVLAPARLASTLTTMLESYRDEAEAYVSWTTYLAGSSQFVLTGTLTEVADGYTYSASPADHLEVKPLGHSLETFRFTTFTGPATYDDTEAFNAATHRVDIQVTDGTGRSLHVVDASGSGPYQQSISGAADTSTQVALARTSSPGLVTYSGTVTQTGLVITIDERSVFSTSAETDTFGDSVLFNGVTYGFSGATLQSSYSGDVLTALSAAGSVTRGGQTVGQLSSRTGKNAAGATEVTVFTEVGSSTSDYFSAVIGN